jgi:hypothetical protein
LLNIYSERCGERKEGAIGSTGTIWNMDCRTKAQKIEFHNKSIFELY